MSWGLGLAPLPTTCGAVEAAPSSACHSCREPGSATTTLQPALPCTVAEVATGNVPGSDTEHTGLPRPRRSRPLDDLQSEGRVSLPSEALILAEAGARNHGNLCAKNRDRKDESVDAVAGGGGGGANDVPSGAASEDCCCSLDAQHIRVQEDSRPPSGDSRRSCGNVEQVVRRKLARCCCVESMYPTLL